MSSAGDKLGTAGGASKEARAFVRERERKIKQRFLAVRVGFTFILIVCICDIIWTGLVSPIIIGYFVRHPPLT